MPLITVKKVSLSKAQKKADQVQRQVREAKRTAKDRQKRNQAMVSPIIHPQALLTHRQLHHD